MLEFIKNAFFIASIVLTIATIIQFARAKPKTWGVVQIKSGSLGSGKTYLSVSELIKRYKKMNRKAVKKKCSE